MTASLPGGLDGLRELVTQVHRGGLERLGDCGSSQKSCQGMWERFGDYQPGNTPLVIPGGFEEVG